MTQQTDNDWQAGRVLRLHGSSPVTQSVMSDE